MIVGLGVVARVWVGLIARHFASRRIAAVNRSSECALAETEFSRRVRAEDRGGVAVISTASEK